MLRLKFLQTALTYLEQHQWYLTIFFAPRLDFEEATWTFSRNSSSSTSSSSTSNDVMHPWAVQLCDDIELLAHCVDGDELSNAYKGNLHNLVWLREVTNIFLNTDARVIVAHWLSTTVGPHLPEQDYPSLKEETTLGVFQ